MTPLSLVTKPNASQETRESMLRILNDMIERVKAGEIESLILLAKHVDQNWGHDYSGAVNFPYVLGQLEIAKFDWIKKYIESY